MILIDAPPVRLMALTSEEGPVVEMWCKLTDEQRAAATALGWSRQVCQCTGGA
eukprot:SAG25_NODE_6312_length_570_cov_0.757962_1_plen_52_part_10